MSTPTEMLLDGMVCKVFSDDVSVHWWARDSNKVGDRCLCGTRTRIELRDGLIDEPADEGDAA